MMKENRLVRHSIFLVGYSLFKSRSNDTEGMNWLIIA